MTLTMTNERAIEIISRIPIVSKSYVDGEAINDLSEALILAIESLKKNDKTDN